MLIISSRDLRLGMSISDVVDEVIARDLYVLTNVHHDSWIWADVTATGANYTEIEEKFYRLWYQIGQKLACKSSFLAFEPINEPPGTTTEHATELMKLEDLFLQALRDSGGFNSERVVTLNGPSEDSIKTSEFFIRPSNITNPWAIQYHYYSPYDFVFAAWVGLLIRRACRRLALTDLNTGQDNMGLRRRQSKSGSRNRQHPQQFH